MGTNFYHRTRSGFLGLFGKIEEKHIGKRSGGWEFSFRGYKSYSDDYALGLEKTIIIGNWQDWKRVLKRGKIFDKRKINRWVGKLEKMPILERRAIAAALAKVGDASRLDLASSDLEMLEDRQV